MAETWRTGRTVGRTVYIGDRLVGLMDTPELAELLVFAERYATSDGPDRHRRADWTRRLADRIASPAEEPHV